MTLCSRACLRRIGPAVLLVAAATAACSTRTEGPAQVEILGTDPGGGAPGAVATSPAEPVAAPTAQGVVSYEGYQTVVAGEGETVAELAGRVGLSASELAAYNGLTPAHQMRDGDELVLPPRPDGYATVGSTGAGGTGGTGETAAISAPASSAPSTSGGIEQAPLPAAADASSEATPPPGAWSPALAEAAIDRSTGITPDGSLGAPPSSVEPVPPEPEPRRELASPDLGQYQTGAAAIPAVRPEAPTAASGAGPATSGVGEAPSSAGETASDQQVAAAVPNLGLQKPVEGPVAIAFNKGAGPARNDGVDFAAAAGSPVVAAADGEVALVSQSLGGLGTIVLLRHPDELLTVYGRIDGVTVSKGDTVRRGQQIGVVSSAAAPDEPRMHFEVRRGAESLDPMQFL